MSTTRGKYRVDMVIGHAGKINRDQSNEHSEHRQDSDTVRRWLPASLRNRLLFFTASARSTHKHSIYVWSLIRNWITKVQANEIEAHIRQLKKKDYMGSADHGLI